ncbi:MAG: glycosyltransferase family 9 protein, partial [Candidatus Omnitrophota bacterium]
KSVFIHKKDQHFSRLKSVFSDVPYAKKRHAIFVNEQARKKAEILFQSFLGASKTYFVVSAGAADSRKRWTREGFVKVCQALTHEYKLPVLFVGNDQDRGYTESIIARLSLGAINLCGKASLLETTWILRNSRLVLCNDSAVMHLASYFDVPVVGLFGPTDPGQYGPWGEKGCFVRTNQWNKKGQGLIDGIEAEEVLAKIKGIL